MNNKKVHMLGVDIDKISMSETLNIIDAAILKRKNIQHVVVNAGKFVLMQKDKALHESVVESDIINADGQSIVWASKLLGNPLPERVAGIDLMEEIVGLANRKKYKCFFLGAKEEVVKKVTHVYAEKYSPEIISGYRNGYFDAVTEEQVVSQIAESNSDILFVAISSPKKEIFLRKYKKDLNVSFIMGVGGSFDVVAGITKRAPLWMQKMGLEWFYRFAQEPGRMWKRYLLGNMTFTSLILKEKIGMYNNPWQDNKQ